MSIASPAPAVFSPLSMRAPPRTVSIARACAGERMVRVWRTVRVAEVTGASESGTSESGQVNHRGDTAHLADVSEVTPTCRKKTLEAILDFFLYPCSLLLRARSVTLCLLPQHARRRS
jgi:hypothetical protein